MTRLFGPPREATPGPVQKCFVFAWIGQTLEHCELCGRPLREHLYHPPYGGAKPIFRAKQWQPHWGWHWASVGSLVKRGEGNQ